MRLWSTLIFGFLILASVLPFFRFNSLRVRNEARPFAERDPQLGRKFAFGIFTHASLLMILCGLIFSADDAVLNSLEPAQAAAEQREFEQLRDAEDGQIRFRAPQAGPPQRQMQDWWNPQQRMAVALVLSGLLHGGMAWAALLFLTNQRRFREVSRSFVVFRFVVCAAALLIVNTLILIGFLAEGEKDYKVIAFSIAVIGICGPAMLGHLIWMMMAYRKKAANGESEA